MSFNLLAIGQAGRLEHEAILLAASLRRSDPGFAGSLFIAEPQPGPKWREDPRMSDRARKALVGLGVTPAPCWLGWSSRRCDRSQCSSPSRRPWP